MTPLDYLNSVVNEYKELKSELIPIDLVTNESENNLVFFQDKKMTELNDNQTVSYSNIGETLELIVKQILQYVDDLKEVDAVALNSDIKFQFLVLNSMYYSDINMESVASNMPAFSIFSYKDISEVKTFIDQINIDNSFSVFSQKLNRELIIEPVLYYLDVKDNIVSKFSLDTSFVPTSIWGAVFIGIKINEKVESGDVLSINGKYTVNIRYNDFNYKDFYMELTNQSGFIVNSDIEFGEIPFFNIIDLFGNNIQIRSVDGALLNVSKDETINKTFDKKILSNIQIDTIVIPFSKWEKISVVNGWSYGRVPECITFNVCKTNTFKDALYFPALTPISNIIKETINGL